MPDDSSIKSAKAIIRNVAKWRGSEPRFRPVDSQTIASSVVLSNSAIVFRRDPVFTKETWTFANKRWELPHVHPRIMRLSWSHKSNAGQVDIGKRRTSAPRKLSIGSCPGQRLGPFQALRLRREARAVSGKPSHIVNAERSRRSALRLWVIPVPYLGLGNAAKADNPEATGGH